MNLMDRQPPQMGLEAQVRFLDGDFRVVKPGSFVRCAVSGDAIPVEELRYWDVDLQEAYRDPQAKLQRLGVQVSL